MLGFSHPLVCALCLSCSIQVMQACFFFFYINTHFLPLSKIWSQILRTFSRGERKSYNFAHNQVVSITLASRGFMQPNCTTEETCGTLKGLAHKHWCQETPSSNATLKLQKARICRITNEVNPVPSGFGNWPKTVHLIL